MPLGRGGNVYRDAPADGKEYVRKDAQWQESSGGGGGSAYWELVDEGTFDSVQNLPSAQGTTTVSIAPLDAVNGFRTHQHWQGASTVPLNGQSNYYSIGGEGANVWRTKGLDPADGVTLISYENLRIAADGTWSVRTRSTANVLKILNDGKVGVGTATPDVKLHVQDGAANSSWTVSSGGYQFEVEKSGGYTQIALKSDDEYGGFLVGADSTSTGYLGWYNTTNTYRTGGFELQAPKSIHFAINDSPNWDVLSIDVAGVVQVNDLAGTGTRLVTANATGQLVSGTTDNSSNWNTAFGWGNHATQGYLTSYTETDPVFVAHVASGITALQISNWDTAYGWGNHSGQYLTINNPTFTGRVISPGANGRVKYDVWNNGAWGFGMLSGVTYGGLNSYAVTSVVNASAAVDAGWWWGDSTQATSTGAMALTKLGNMTLNGTLDAGGTVTAPTFVGALTGNVTGNVTGSSGSCTGNAATATWADTVDVNPNNTGTGNYELVWCSGDVLYSSDWFYINRDAKTLYATNFSGNGAAVTSVNAAQLNGKTSTSAGTVSTIVERNTSGDINCRLVRPTYTNQTTISGAMAYRINNSSDNYIRFCSNPAAIRTWLDVPSTGEVGGEIDHGSAHPSANLDYTGQVVNIMAGGTITAGYAVALWTDTIRPEVLHADADDIRPVLGIAINGGAAGTKIKVLIEGVVKLTGIQYSVAAGSFAYASTTAGYITPTPSGTAGDYIKIIGYGLATDVLYVRPQFNWVAT